MNTDDIYPCVGICLPDEDEAYCIGCGRPWGAPVNPPAGQLQPPAASRDDDQPQPPG